MTRADYLAAWATGFDAERIPYYDYRDEKIDVFGDTALVRSTNKRVGLKDGACRRRSPPVQPANYPPDETIVRKYIKGKAQT